MSTKSINEKHAYLIMAHKNDHTLNTLLSLLDYPLNDIYLHMDKKSGEINKNDIESNLKFSNIEFIERRNVNWGGFSQINIELSLLEKALENKPYGYYHLISGEDLPLAPQNIIHDFFRAHKGKEFIQFESETFNHDNRVKYYHFYQEIIGKKGNMFQRISKKIFLKLQSLVGVNRHNELVFQKGANWFSITESLAEYVIHKKEWIYDTFRYTYCCDEVFLQTLVHNSHFKNNLYNNQYDNSLKSIMRYIDWNRGAPYVFRNSDYDELIESNMLYARKFDAKIDMDIIDAIKNKILLKE